MGDARRLVQDARARAQENVMHYDEPIHIETLSKDISGNMQAVTQYGGTRPFGVSFIIGGVDETGARLFETEPSGALAEYMAVAIGAGRKEAMEFFEKNFQSNLTREQAVKLVFSALEQGLPKNQRLSLDRVDFGFVDKDKSFMRMDKNELKAVVGTPKADKSSADSK